MAGDARSVNTPAALSARLSGAMEERHAQGLERTLRVRRADEPFLDLANNDYLRLSQHPDVKAAAIAATERWGCSSAASPLITGYTEAHESLLETLKQWCGFRHGLLWNTGFAANSAVLSGLPRRGDLVLADRLIHNSMVNGLLASGARLQRYRHLDLDHLGELLEQNAGKYETLFVVSETVYSMDGDYPELQAMAALKERYGFIWVLDEAHALGWYGEGGSGLIEAAGVSAAVDVMVGTLGKGLGSMGAFTLFHDEILKRYLINHSGEFIYSTYLPPSCAAAAEKAVELLRGDPAERPRLHTMAGAFREMLEQGTRAGEAVAAFADSPIVPVRVADPVAAAEALLQQGIRVGAIRPPTVPAGEGRLRISLNALLSEPELQRVAAAINALRA
ncbi:8-amino-7-oxononanoate synthase [Ruficoccus sp. ZRK36]|uniref:aminotransferase class I/II-fold pyridoxal phosphate-dependent enzyme n=1 Tax=Ruficoccus sp. ZRK36 TaxID=2866311 RepID=UPI001C72EA91|nr:8-amino-7-oxononanoate synthase [Ruficoccus sp. ZRK36]QYY34674.1 8-amino-7-oxononanoate synthase [Ruficoccus sp. ZRK36]